MKKAGFVLTIVLLMTGVATGASAESFAIHTLGSEGITPAEAMLVTGLLRAEVAQINKGPVNLVENTECYEEACAKKMVQGVAVDAVVVGKIYQLGDSITLSLDVVRKKETLHYRVVLEKIDEINRIAPRLADAIVSKRGYGESITVSSVSSYEAEKYKKVQGDFSWGPSLGFLVPVNNSYGGADIIYTIDLLFRYEIAHMGFEFDTGVYFNDNGSEDTGAGEWPLDFAMYYYFFEKDNTPFVGGSFGLHYIGLSVDQDSEDEDSFGAWTPSVSAFAGYELLRTHNLHISFKLGYRTGFVALDGPGAHGGFFAMAMTF